MAAKIKHPHTNVSPNSNGHAPKGSGNMHYVAYLRVSSEEQRERGTIQTQLSVLEDYCKREGITLHEVYRDDGISGTVPFAERPSGSKLLQDARAKQVDCVLLFKFDRLGRNTLESLIAAQTLEGLGVSIKSVTEPFDTSTAAGRFMMTQLASFAQLERENIRERSIAGTNRIVREGKAPPGRPPYGYMIGPDRRLTVNETPIPGCDKSEAEVVRLIFRWVAEEHLSLLGIADRLHTMGIPPSSLTEGRKRKPRTGTYAAGVWPIAALSVLIHRTTYKGVYQFGRISRQPNRELITVPVPAIVSLTLWEQAQEALQRNLQWAKRNAHREYLLSGLIRCGFCGRRMQAFTPTRRSPLYRCGISRKHDGLLFVGGVCPSRSVPLDWINDLIWEELKNWILNHHDLEAVMTEALQGQNQKRREWEESLARVRRDFGQTETQRGRVLTLYRKGLVSDADLEKQLSELKAETQQLQHVAEELEKRLSFTIDTDTAVVTIQHQLESFRKALHKKTVPFQVKRKIVETFVDEVVVTLERGSALHIALRETIPFRPKSANRQTKPGQDGDKVTCWQRAGASKMPEDRKRTVQIFYHFPFPPQPEKLASIAFTTG